MSTMSAVHPRGRTATTVCRADDPRPASCQKGRQLLHLPIRRPQTTGYEGCTTTLKIAADGSRVALLRFGKGGGAGTQLLIEAGTAATSATTRRRLRLPHAGRHRRRASTASLTEKGGTAKFGYLLDANSAELVSRNRLEVTVTHVN